MKEYCEQDLVVIIGYSYLHEIIIVLSYMYNFKPITSIEGWKCV